MIPGPNEIPVTIDCVVLAETGVNALLPLIVGLAIVAFGIVFFALSRGRLRKSGAALGLVLLLAVGGSVLSISAPASSASADDCTPRDYAIEGSISTDVAVDPGTDVTITFSLTNVVDRDGLTPIVVRIPKSLPISAAVLDAPSTNWALDSVSDPLNFVLTYSGLLPKGTMSSDALFTFTTVNLNTQQSDTDIPVTIDTGSGGDTVTSNNSFTVNLLVNGNVG